VYTHSGCGTRLLLILSCVHCTIQWPVVHHGTVPQGAAAAAWPVAAGCLAAMLVRFRIRRCSLRTMQAAWMNDSMVRPVTGSVFDEFEIDDGWADVLVRRTAFCQ
jgi:hypothetical protein